MKKQRLRGTNRIPPSGGEESRSVAASVIATNDIFDGSRFPQREGIVQPEVNPAERVLSS